ncbi:hypothetical protein D3C77_431040 [compost metagenome]
MPLFIRRRPKAAGKTCSFEPAAFSHMMQCFAIPTLTRFKADSHQGYHFSGFFQRPAQPLPPLERDSGLDFRREVGGQAAPAGHLQDIRVYLHTEHALSITYTHGALCRPVCTVVLAK